MKYFIYVEGDDTYWYTTEADFAKALDEFDFLGNFCDDGWSEDVEHCMAGAVPADFVLDPDDHDRDQLQPFATHHAEKFDVTPRPSDDQLDEEGRDGDGTYWGEWIYTCNYHFAPIATEGAAS